MSARFTIAERMRAGHVKRWQIVRVAREQSIAEHMYRVHAIAEEICERMQLSTLRKLAAGRWALIHDLPEVITGDIATPTKKAMRAAIQGRDPLRTVELSLDSGYNSMYRSLKTYDPMVLDVVKIADLIEAVDFLVTEALGVHAVAVLNDTREAVRNLLDHCQRKYPEFEWFRAAMVYSELTHPPELREDMGL